jgi:hypothetical protein
MLAPSRSPNGRSAPHAAATPPSSQSWARVSAVGSSSAGRRTRAARVARASSATKRSTRTARSCNGGNRGCVEAFVRGALEAKDVRLAGKLLGIGIGNAIALLAPDLIVVGGGVAVTGERLLRPLRKEIRRRVKVSVPVDVVPSSGSSRVRSERPCAEPSRTGLGRVVA